MTDPTLIELEEQQAEHGRAFKAAKDRLGQGRDRAIAAIQVLADLEVRALTDNAPDREALEAARSERRDALQALAAIERQLRPDRDDLGVLAQGK